MLLAVWLFASVVPTAAPREFSTLANIGRGVEGSRRSVLGHAATRHSPQNVNFHSLGESSDGRDGGVGLASFQADDLLKSRVERDDPWEEFPMAAWLGTGHGDPSTPRQRFSWQQDARGAAVGMTALRKELRRYEHNRLLLGHGCTSLRKYKYSVFPGRRK